MGNWELTFSALTGRVAKQVRRSICLAPYLRAIARAILIPHSQFPIPHLICLIAPAIAQHADLPKFSQVDKQAVAAEISQLSRDYQQTLSQLAQLPAKDITWDKSFGAIDSYEAKLNTLYTLNFGIQAGSSGQIVNDETATQCMMMLMMVKMTTSHNPAVTAALQTAAEQPWVKQLSAEKQHFIKRTLQRCISEGCQLSPEQRAQFKQLQMDIMQLCQQYQVNIMTASMLSSTSFDDPQALDGMSDTWMARAKAIGEQYGGGTSEKPIYWVGCNFSEVNELLKHCKVEESRKRVYKTVEALGTQAPHDNTALFEQILEKRHALAQMLGYASWADMRCASGMFGKASTATAALQELYNNSLELWQQDSQMLLDTQAKLRGQDKAQAGDTLESWNILYLAEQAAQQHHGFNEAELQAYLPAQGVVQSMFEIYEQLFGVRVQQIEGEVEVWKQGVTCYSVHNSDDGKLLGYFYMDIFQDGKEGNGTMMRPLRCRVQNSKEPALAILFCSFPPAVEGQPALLQFADVPTLFHEFGHVMHLMCSETELHSSGSQHCEMDFIEMPSQLLENWAWEPSIIKKFAKHYQSGELIPDELLTKLVESRYAKSIMDHYLTLQLGMSDLGIHGEGWQHFTGGGATQRVQALCPCPYPLSDMGEKPNMFLKQGQFVDNAYPGILYTYSWGRVMAADVFGRFQKEGLLNAELGKEYREKILNKGASLPASELYRDFMGREPDSKAQMKQLFGAQ